MLQKTHSIPLKVQEKMTVCIVYDIVYKYGNTV